MNKQKERLEIKLLRVEKVLEALYNDKLTPDVMNTIIEFLLDYKKKIQYQIKYKKKVSPEQKALYMKNYRAKQRAQSSASKNLEDLLK